MTGKLDRCYFQAASAGTGDFIYDETEAGYLTPVGADDGSIYYYIAEVLTGGVPTQWELGTGTWVTATQKLTRGAFKSSNGGLTVDFSDPPKIRMGVPLATDWPVVTLVVGGSGINIDSTSPEEPVVSTVGFGGTFVTGDARTVTVVDGVITGVA